MFRTIFNRNRRSEVRMRKIAGYQQLFSLPYEAGFNTEVIAQQQDAGFIPRYLPIAGGRLSVDGDSISFEVGKHDEDGNTTYTLTRNKHNIAQKVETDEPSGVYTCEEFNPLDPEHYRSQRRALRACRAFSSALQSTY